ncbi:hypothetical protein LOTGIDRAFT_228315 [Lottia gigantea]|uniref:VWFC domain-containing protein n=1 Tax=Lottia gigantea TaxID=225164 RepID=V4AS86_LOTGI|nr:hypothetical protein LOTGIDRAFT_228315 [Lottia gigantea]ESO97735.1 hypothetical protein LOTGIDRAFT_228315 [Lottia gigantea]
MILILENLGIRKKTTPALPIKTCNSSFNQLFLCLTPGMDSAQCYDFQGNPVNNGEKYVPNKEDPCMTCICDKGFRIMCKSVACSPPGNCELWEQIEGVCCEYKCIKSGSGNNVQGGGPGNIFNVTNPELDGGRALEDESITNLGLRLVASTVTSFLVLALLLFMVHRLRQRRLLLAMRRFEAQARRQQLEEADSDHYIPETFLGIECPPYEDPPPPYSPPKPHPRIMPGEAPPPYEEIDQNPLSPLNNNEINRAITEENSAPTPRQCSINMENNNNTEASSQCVQTSATPNVECRIENENMRRSTNTSDTVTRGVCVLPDSSGNMHTYANTSSASQNRNCASYIDNQLDSTPTSPTGRVPLLSSSRDDSHECSCDEDQTMLKRYYSYEHQASTSFNNTQPSTCQESPLLQQNQIRSSQPSELYANCLPHSVMSASMTEQPDPKKLIRQYDRFSSLPRQIRSTDEHQFSNPSPLREVAETEQGIPLVEMRKNVSTQDISNAPSTSTGSPPQASLRTAADGASRQDLLRGNLQPLTLSDKVTPLCSNILVQNNGQALVQSSEARLRNLRLYNLAHSPTKQLDSPNSPVTPEELQIKRSQSVTSEVSIFSICSETGELRIPKPMTQSLRCDSQYPDIPIRPNFLRQLTSNVETFLGTVPKRNFASHQDQSVSKITEDNDAKVAENPALDQSDENQLCVSDVGGPIGASALIKNFNKLNSELKDNSRKKEKEKPKANRFSTGSLPAQKPKKTRSVNPEAGPSKSSESTSKKHDTAKRKGVKQSSSIKQYGFIDNSAGTSSQSTSNNSVKLDCLKGSSRSKEGRGRKELDNQRTKPDHAPRCDLSVLQPTPELKTSRQIKPGVKRQLNYLDKNNHSPSPTRQKSRPKTMFPTCHKESESGTWNDLSKESTSNCVPRRKGKSSSSRSKKRQSYPVSNIQTAESTGIVLSRPNIIGCVSDMTNETVPPLNEAGVSQEPTRLNGYVYKYNTDSPQDNPNVYVKLRPTSLSSYV